MTSPVYTKALSFSELKGWLTEKDWKTEETALCVVDASLKQKGVVRAPSPAQVRRQWERTWTKLRKNPLWKQDTKTAVEEAFASLSKTHSIRKENISPDEALRLALTQTFLRILHFERTLIKRGQKRSNNAWTYQRLFNELSSVMKRNSSLQVETESDCDFLLHFRIATPDRDAAPFSLEKYVNEHTFTRDDVEWGKTFLEGRKLSPEVVEIASCLLLFIEHDVSTRSYNKASEINIIQLTVEVARLANRFRLLTVLSTRFAPALVHIFSRSVAYLEALEENSDQFPPHPADANALYAFLHEKGYHSRQTLLYQHLEKQFRKGNDLLSSEKFTQIAPPLFANVKGQVVSAYAIRTLLHESAYESMQKALLSFSKPSSDPCPEPPPSPVQEEELQEPEESLRSSSNLERAVRSIFSPHEEEIPDPWTEEERVSRWFFPDATEECRFFPDRHPTQDRPLYADRSLYARRVLTLVHSVPRQVRALLSHPNLRTIYSRETDSGLAMMVEISTDREVSGLYGVLELGWDRSKEGRRLHHYMWTQPSHSCLKREQIPFPKQQPITISSLFRVEESVPPPENLHLYPDERIALWDCNRKLWYTVWPAGKKSQKNLDFSDPQSMAKGGFWR